MSFPVMNAQVNHSQMIEVLGDSATAIPFLTVDKYHPQFNVPAPVDVTGMELAVALIYESATTVTQVNAGGAATTFVMKFFDMGTTATGGTTNVLGGADAFSNSADGGYTVHEAKKTNGTSTTDLDADDWVTVAPTANATALVGSVTAGAAFIYGVPGDIN